MIPTVKTLNNTGLREAATSLNMIVFKDFIPDIIIGIRSGGYVVAEIMAQEARHKPILLAISRQRDSTRKKNKVKGLKNILRLLPYPVTDRLRLWEHKRLNGKPPAGQKPFTPDAGELAVLREALAVHENRKILVVDDAVDSGETMKSVLEMIGMETNSACIIKSAAVTVTTDSPLIQPDYTLYRHVLCRFPWSFDFKE